MPVYIIAYLTIYSLNHSIFCPNSDTFTCGFYLCKIKEICIYLFECQHLGMCDLQLSTDLPGLRHDIYQSIAFVRSDLVLIKICCHLISQAGRSRVVGTMRNSHLTMSAAKDQTRDFSSSDVSVSINTNFKED